MSAKCYQGHARASGVDFVSYGEDDDYSQEDSEGYVDEYDSSDEEVECDLELSRSYSAS